MAENTCFFRVILFLYIISTVAGVIKNTQSYSVAKLDYCNPKYFSLCYVATTRRVVDGVERFFTNHTFTNIVTLSNNLTASGVLQSCRGTQYNVQRKFCDFFKQAWMQEFVKKSTNMTLPCPVPPRTTRLNDLEIPASNVSLPLLPGTYLMESEVYTTDSKERLVRIHYTIHFSEAYKPKRKNTNRNKKG